MTLAYYNEIDPFAAQWLRNLIAAGHIAGGHVDERSIVDVRPADLRGYTQAHFFAGIGGWSLAARLAGWPDDKPIWTGSCPCQPFSAAGKRKGTADERHLWPEFFRLIDACQPSVVVGEQVASSEVVGTQLEAEFAIAIQAGDAMRANKLAKRLVRSAGFHFDPRWVDGVRADFQAADYAFWMGVYGAHSVGAPHIRQRLWWLGHSKGFGRVGRSDDKDGGRRELASGRAGASSGMADATRERERPDRFRRDSGEGFVVVRPGTRGHRSDDGATCDGLDDSNGARHARPRSGEPGEQEGRSGLLSVGREVSDTFWSRYELVPCRDGTARRIEPGVFPLAHGVSGRVGRLRAYGNAIVPQVAAEILRAYLEGMNP